ncbi:hypothetical protein PHLGIDRAFT_101835 [Phlebiopsis gigantea 11061_1 CR5-6]|uniref:NADH-ubiquinone oxidoreductase 21kDa subunit N-terminal domain-containing protein n=1 Tax=Phlebiopsis gigantea (strain 11061_1 CR5-6) TaxID=745531 RepID=A0A0C3PRR8_PHLG1|nr:hypothetical protein PHLGIDRAFT_101835 [Phlebiopsis gigantea 11061_1 CR5-6]
MPEKVVTTPYPLIDVDPYVGRVMRYMRPSDYAVWAGATAAFPAALYFWEIADRTYSRLRTPLRYGGLLGFVGGFLLAYQRSSFRFWGWSENSREQELDKSEMTERARLGLPIYGHSNEPEWVQGAAYRNSAFSQLKFAAFPRMNFVNHPYHGVDPSKYKKDEES